MAIVALLLFLFGIVMGSKIGAEMAKNVVTTREYWLANLKIVVVGVLASMVIGLTGFSLLAGVAIGGMGGAIAGLKMEFGESSGPWKFIDRSLGVNKDQLRRAGDKNAEAVRRARRDGTPMPEYMSVSQDDAEGEKGASDGAGASPKGFRTRRGDRKG
ncbi:hypothetical protein [Olsenella porci]|jgi:hypothetical protein|uniref:hypothetical protein n=1 Tax=Olsenella porci TaxID=2652279 RepID=UPI001E34AE44|nr:hypothetical protein [Olsenella porci]